jgi:hypothetical protein
LLDGTPAQLGQHVLAVCVQEFRNGVLLSENKRDFQFNVIAGCTAVPPIQASVNPLALVPNGTKVCNGLTAPFYFFYNNAQPSTTTPYSSFLWDFGVPGVATDVSTQQNPIFTFPAEGNYTITLTGNPNTSCPVSYTLDISLFNPITLSIEIPPGNEQCISNNNFEFVAAGDFDLPATFDWVFGPDASISASTLQNPNGIVWSLPGTYNVTYSRFGQDCFTLPVAINPVETTPVFHD